MYFTFFSTQLEYSPIGQLMGPWNGSLTQPKNWIIYLFNELFIYVWAPLKYVPVP